MKTERTLVIIKPDGVQRGLMGEIIRRIEQTGLKFVAFKFLVPTEEQCWTHYNKADAWFEEKGARIMKNKQELGLPVEKTAREYGQDIIRNNVKFFTSGPLLAMVVEGNKSVGVVKKLVGTTEPLTSDVGTIRGDLTIDSYDLAELDGRPVRNLVHCTDDPKESDREISIWFKPEEMINYYLIGEKILYDIQLEGLLK